MVAAKGPDEEHAYGHAKAEYFSSGLEGGLVILAAGSIVVAAIPRLLRPEPIEQIGWGLAVSTLASLVNLGVARRLFRAAKEYRSITLEADARHLLTDVWTSAGVLIGVGATVLTGWERIDPIVALVVAANILWTGARLVGRYRVGSSCRHPRPALAHELLDCRIQLRQADPTLVARDHLPLVVDQEEPRF